MNLKNHKSESNKTEQIKNTVQKPMWFSPIHTPNNWKIANKRRKEHMQNSFIILTETKNLLSQECDYDNRAQARTLIENFLENNNCKNNYSGYGKDALLYDVLECKTNLNHVVKLLSGNLDYQKFAEARNIINKMHATQKETIIDQALSTDEGRKELAQCMVEPKRNILEYEAKEGYIDGRYERTILPLLPKKTSLESSNENITTNTANTATFIITSDTSNVHLSGIKANIEIPEWRFTRATEDVCKPESDNNA